MQAQSARPVAGPFAQAAAIDRQPLSAFHWKLLIVAGIGWMFDAMDVGLITFVLPVLGGQWQLGPELRGLILSVGFLGMFVGAAAAGALADRIGRKVVFQSTLGIFAIATGLSAFIPAPTLPAGIPAAGVDLGASQPVPFACGECLDAARPAVPGRPWAGRGATGGQHAGRRVGPANQRGRMMVLLESFWAYGWIAAAAIGLLLIPSKPFGGSIDGWRIAFALGAIPALYTLLLRRGLPESPRYLESRGDSAAARRAVQAAGLQAGAETAEATPASRGVTVGAALRRLWSASYARHTVMLWVLWFGMVFSYYGIFSWLPTLMTQHSTLVRGFEYTLLITLAQVPGYFSAAWLVERWGRKPTLVTYLLGSAIGALLDTGLALAHTRLCPTSGSSSRQSSSSFFNLAPGASSIPTRRSNIPPAVRGSAPGGPPRLAASAASSAPYVPGWWAATNLGKEGLFGIFTVVFLITSAGAVFFLARRRAAAGWRSLPLKNERGPAGRYNRIGNLSL